MTLELILLFVSWPQNFSLNLIVSLIHFLAMEKYFINFFKNIPHLITQHNYYNNNWKSQISQPVRLLAIHSNLPRQSTAVPKITRNYYCQVVFYFHIKYDLQWIIKSALMNPVPATENVQSIRMLFLRFYYERS